MATYLDDIVPMAVQAFESDAGPGVSDSAYGYGINPYSEIYAPASYQLPGFSPFYVGPGDIYSQIMSRMAQSQPPYSAGPVSSGLLGGYDPNLYARLQQERAAQEATQGLLDNAPTETGAGGGIDFGDMSSFSGSPADTIALGQALSAYANATMGFAPGALLAGLLGSAITNAGINALGEMEADAAAQAAAAQSMEAVAQEAAQQAALTQGDEAIAAYDAATLAAAEAAAQAAAEAAAQEAAAIEAAQAEQAAIEAAQAEQAAIDAALSDAMAGYGESGGGYGASYGGEAGALGGAGLAGMGLGLDSVGGLGGLGGLGGISEGESVAMGDVSGMGLGLNAADVSAAAAAEAAAAAAAADAAAAAAGAEAGAAAGGDLGYGSGGWGGEGEGSGGFYAKGGKVTAKGLLMDVNTPGPDDGLGGLQIGEWVIKKSTAKKLGDKKLRALNEGKASIKMRKK